MWYLGGGSGGIAPPATPATFALCAAAAAASSGESDWDSTAPPCSAPIGSRPSRARRPLSGGERLGLDRSALLGADRLVALVVRAPRLPLFFLGEALALDGLGLDTLAFLELQGEGAEGELVRVDGARAPSRRELRERDCLEGPPADLQIELLLGQIENGVGGALRGEIPFELPELVEALGLRLAPGELDVALAVGLLGP